MQKEESTPSYFDAAITFQQARGAARDERFDCSLFTFHIFNNSSASATITANIHRESGRNQSVGGDTEICRAETNRLCQNGYFHVQLFGLR